MKPDEHYAEAEKLLHAYRCERYGDALRLEWLAEAQVHATLALYRPDYRHDWSGYTPDEGAAIFNGPPLVQPTPAVDKALAVES